MFRKVVLDTDDTIIKIDEVDTDLFVYGMEIWGTLYKLHKVTNTKWAFINLDEGETFFQNKTFASAEDAIKAAIEDDNEVHEADDFDELYKGFDE
jgi:hypothetical protein